MIVPSGSTRVESGMSHRINWCRSLWLHRRCTRARICEGVVVENRSWRLMLYLGRKLHLVHATGYRQIHLLLNGVGQNLLLMQGLVLELLIRQLLLLLLGCEQLLLLSELVFTALFLCVLRLRSL